MQLTVIRKWLTPNSTCGMMTVDGIFACYTLELPKSYQGALNVPDKTCIPAGTYPVQIQFSPKHGFDVPWVLNVPNRSDIEIHPANEPSELLGCTAVGQTYSPEVPDWIGNSKAAFASLMAELAKANGNISITYEDYAPPVTDVEL